MQNGDLWDKWTKERFTQFCLQRFNSGMWNEPYVLIPADGLKALITPDETVIAPKTVTFTDISGVEFEVSD